MLDKIRAVHTIRKTKLKITKWYSGKQINKWKINQRVGLQQENSLKVCQLNGKVLTLQGEFKEPIQIYLGNWHIRYLVSVFLLEDKCRQTVRILSNNCLWFSGWKDFNCLKLWFVFFPLGFLLIHWVSSWSEAVLRMN